MLGSDVQINSTCTGSHPPGSLLRSKISYCLRHSIQVHFIRDYGSCQEFYANYLVIKNSVVEIENTGYNDNKEINVKSTFLFLEYRIFKSKDIEA